MNRTKSNTVLLLAIVLAVPSLRATAVPAGERVPATRRYSMAANPPLEAADAKPRADVQPPPAVGARPLDVASRSWFRLGIPAMRFTSMAFDEARGQVVLFGGEALGGGYLDETWVWSGNAWTQRFSAVHPPARTAHCIVYDAAREQIVLYGGWDSSGRENGPLDDTWVWDGNSWSEKKPAHTPGGYDYHAMAYDAARGQVVLFGGWNGMYSWNDTWIWDGNDWTKKSPARSPNSRYDHSLAFDAAHGQVVMFGGREEYSDFNDETWVWDGANWTQKTPAQSPPAGSGGPMTYDLARARVVRLGSGRTWLWDGSNWSKKSSVPSAESGAAIACDSIHRQVVIFGGWYNNDTWVWDGSNWTKRVASPKARVAPASTYDAVRRQVVLFGGGNQDGWALNDTWVWDEGAWIPKSPTLSPPAGGGGAMAYDAAREQVVLFGGYALGVGSLDRTWTWDGSNWTPRSPGIAPSARHQHAMASDAVRRLVVLFGGSGRKNDTWVWDGNIWTEKQPTVRPAARYYHAMAFDEARGQLVLFGGLDDSDNRLNDTWVWDGTNWTAKSPAIGPSARYGHSMAYDPVLGKVVLFGGSAQQSDQLNETWLWDGSNWTQETPGLSPPARAAFAMTYDVAQQRVVIFGGESNYDAMSDTWALSSRPACSPHPADTNSNGRIEQSEVTAYATAWRNGASWSSPPSPPTTDRLTNAAWISVSGGEYHCDVTKDPPWVSGAATSSRGTGVLGAELDSIDATATQSATSTLSPSSYTPGSAVVVRLTITPDSAIRAYAVEDAPPPGWAVTNVDNSGVWDAARGTVKWGLFFDGAVRTLSYTVTPPTGEAGLKTFIGAASFDGARRTIFGARAITGSAAKPYADYNWSLLALPGLSAPAMAYDAAHGQVVLFGGSTLASGASDITWVWDGSAWSRRHPAESPSARYGHAMVYDPGHQEVVLFGGCSGGGCAYNGWYQNDTWVWNGSTWTRKSPAHSPDGRQRHALAYDSVRRQVVLFGGDQGGYGGELSDTWTWDGSDWRKQTPVLSPTYRRGHGMAFDPLRGNVVMFGGYNSDDRSLSDTWVWDGSKWAQQNPAVTPRAGFGSGMTFDAARGQVVMHGWDSNIGGSEGRPQTWVWDGLSWVQKTPALSPPGRSSFAMTYDAGRSQILLVGGARDSRTYYADTWAWDGTTWAKRSDSPSARLSTMAYDAARREVVLFGDAAGYDNDDTWVWGGGGWVEKTPAVKPPGRWDHAMAFDASRAQVVLFGGYGRSDTWVWDGSTWTEKRPSVTPPARRSHAMAYDDVRGQVVLFGGGNGDDPSNSPRNDTWVWNGSQWAQKSPTMSPSARSSPAMAGDAAHGNVVLFGGQTSPGSYSNETWLWDGSTWTKQSPRLSPSARSSHVMAYDPVLGRVLMFGGANTDGELSDAWSWDGTTWTQESPEDSPPPISGAAMVYDIARHQFVLFGGYSDSDDVQDTWAWSTDPAKLSLQGGRVSIQVTWKSQYTGATGTATAIPQKDEFGFFYFSDPNNPEVFVKVLDFGASSPYLVFYAGLTDYEYTVTFTNLSTGKTLSFLKPAGSYAGGADNQDLSHAIAHAVRWSRDGEWSEELSAANTALVEKPAGLVTPGPWKAKTPAAENELLLSNGHVAASVNWRSQYSGQTGQAMPLPQKDAFGFFYFSDANNPEVFVKVLDFGASSPYLIFFAGLTDFEYTVTFRNVQTGQTASFKKDAGSYNGGADNTSLKH